MITYIDTSSLLKLVIEEPGSERVGRIWDAADVVTSVVLVVVEASAALAAAERGSRLTTAQYAEARSGLASLLDELTMVAVTDDLIDRAAALAEQEVLRGYDAVHLAGALTVGADVLASADAALGAAGERCGLHVANPLEG